MFFFLFGIEELFAFNGADFFLLTLKTSTTLYVQEVVTLQKMRFTPFINNIRYIRVNLIRLQSKIIFRSRELN